MLKFMETGSLERFLAALLPCAHILECGFALYGLLHLEDTMTITSLIKFLFRFPCLDVEIERSFSIATILISFFQLIDEVFLNELIV